MVVESFFIYLFSSFFLELQDLIDLKKENEELKKVIYELTKEKDKELEELTQKFSQLKVKNVASQQIEQAFIEQEFRVPSPIEDKFADLTVTDFLSEEEAPLQRKEDGTFYYYKSFIKL